jgi:peptidoglycan/xylan/chitin deacetylase (PgdA/CDA1 family)
MKATPPLSVVAAFTLVGAAALAFSAEPSGSIPWPKGARAAVVLTYDDGMDAQLDHAAPDLDSVGLKGTFYVHLASPSLAKRLPEWRALGLRGHELANHAIFHPCLKTDPKGGTRDWVRPEFALENYTVERIRDEAAAMNTMLWALDGERTRTFAYNCTETSAGGRSYVEALRPLFLAARIGDDRIVEDVRGQDPHLVPSWAVEGTSGPQMIAFAQRALDRGGLAVFQFHGVGGQWISVSREAHRELLQWLADRRDTVWTDTFRNVMSHVVAEQRKPAPAP